MAPTALSMCGFTVTTDDGAAIYCEYGGKIDLAAGRVISAPTFPCADERYDWLDRSQFIGDGTLDSGGQCVDLRAVRSAADLISRGRGCQLPTATSGVDGSASCPQSSNASATQSPRWPAVMRSWSSQIAGAGRAFAQARHERVDTARNRRLRQRPSEARGVAHVLHVGLADSGGMLGEVATNSHGSKLRQSSRTIFPTCCPIQTLLRQSVARSHPHAQ